jgi:hypothetical protein
MRTDWQDRGACAGEGHDQYFAHHRTVLDSTVLLSRCHLACPVQAECLNHALDEPETYGSWGGFTETELFGIRTKRYSRCKRCQRRWPKGSLTDHTTCRWCYMDMHAEQIAERWGLEVEP